MIHIYFKNDFYPTYSIGYPKLLECIPLTAMLVSDMGR